MTIRCLRCCNESGEANAASFLQKTHEEEGATVSIATAKDIRMDAAVAAVSSDVDGNFTLKEEQQ